MAKKKRPDNGKPEHEQGYEHDQRTARGQGHFVTIHEGDGGSHAVFIKGPAPQNMSHAGRPKGLDTRARDAGHRADFISGGQVSGRQKDHAAAVKTANKLRTAREAHNEGVKSAQVKGQAEAHRAAKGDRYQRIQKIRDRAIELSREKGSFSAYHRAERYTHEANHEARQVFDRKAGAAHVAAGVKGRQAGFREKLAAAKNKSKPGLKEQAAAHRAGKGTMSERYAKVSERYKSRGDVHTSETKALHTREQELYAARDRARGKKGERQKDLDQFHAENKDRFMKRFDQAGSEYERGSRYERLARASRRATSPAEARSRVELADNVLAAKATAKPDQWTSYGRKEKAPRSAREHAAVHGLLRSSEKNDDVYHTRLKEGRLILSASAARRRANATSNAEATAKVHQDRAEVARRDYEEANRQERRDARSVKRATPEARAAAATEATSRRAENTKGRYDRLRERLDHPSIARPSAVKPDRREAARALRAETAAKVKAAHREITKTPEAQARIKAQQARADARQGAKNPLGLRFDKPAVSMAASTAHVTRQVRAPQSGFREKLAARKAGQGKVGLREQAAAHKADRRSGFSDKDIKRHAQELKAMPTEARRAIVVAKKYDRAGLNRQLHPASSGIAEGRLRLAAGKKLSEGERQSIVRSMAHSADKARAELRASHAPGITAGAPRPASVQQNRTLGRRPTSYGSGSAARQAEKAAHLERATAMLHEQRAAQAAPRPSLREQVERHRAGKGTREERVAALQAKNAAHTDKRAAAYRKMEQEEQSLTEKIRKASNSNKGQARFSNLVARRDQIQIASTKPSHALARAFNRGDFLAGRRSRRSFPANPR